MGIFGSDKNPQVVSEKDLNEIYDSFQSMGSSPVTLGHDFSSTDPRLGEVIELELKDGELYGVVKEHDALAAAVDEGFFPDCSIGAERSSETGKMYLHHLAYLGEEPPAIKDLRTKVKQSLGIAASDSGTVVIFPATKNSFEIKLSDMTKGVFMNEEDLKKKVAELEAENAKLKAEAEKAESGGDGAELEKLKAENDALKKKLISFQEKYPEDSLALSDASPQVRQLMASLRKTKRDEILSLAKGKLSPAQQNAVLALSDSLPVGELSLSDGKKLSAHDCLKNLLEQLPSASWANEVISLSDADAGGGEKKEAVSAAKMFAHV